MVSFDNSLSNADSSTETRSITFYVVFFVVLFLTEKARLSEKQSVADEASIATVTSQDDDSALKSHKSIELLVINGQQSRV